MYKSIEISWNLEISMNIKVYMYVNALKGWSKLQVYVNVCIHIIIYTIEECLYTTLEK